MKVLGLTGGMGMGKSTVSKLFARHAVPIWDADAVVHSLYRQGGQGTMAIGVYFPEAIEEGAVDRRKLAEIAREPGKLDLIESIMAPLINQSLLGFLHSLPAEVVLLDVPLLYEKNLDVHCDEVILVTCSAATQKLRCMARPGMTEEKFDWLLSRQIPDKFKRNRAHRIIDTDKPIEEVAAEVDGLVAEFTGRTPR